MLGSLTLDNLAPVQNELMALAKLLAEEVLKREIKETNTKIEDHYLQGMLELLQVLSQRYPQLKLDIG